MADLDKLREKLAQAVEKESHAMTRLRRAQTLYDKYYEARFRAQVRVAELEIQINHLHERLKGK